MDTASFPAPRSLEGAVVAGLLLLATPAIAADTHPAQRPPLPAVQAQVVQSPALQSPVVAQSPAVVARREQQLRRIEQLQRSGGRADAGSLMPLLKDPDELVRERAENAIWTLWGRSGRPAIDRLFRAGVAHVNRREIAEAISTFTVVVDTMPTFAEAWNKRATARFLAGDLIGAMEDCERALQLVPDHFGSLAGYGHIYFRLDDMDMAILYWRRALEVNPNLDSIARSIEAAERILRGRGRLRT